MKNRKIVFLAFLLCLLPLGGRLSAQASFKTYECETLPVQAHVFSAGAQTFTFSTGDITEISPLWINASITSMMTAVEQYSTAKPAPKTATASLPGNGFYFGSKQMKYFGLTGGGLVYFGETDQLYPTYTPEYGMGSNPAPLEDFLCIRFSTKEAASGATEVYADENTTVQYEFSATQDTLFVAYNNVKVFDASDHASVFTFQYVFTRDGEVLFIPVAMQPQGSTLYLVYGLFQNKKGGRYDECRFLKDLDGTVYSTGYTWMAIKSTQYPTQTYRMAPPASCTPVENPVVEWSYTAATDYIELDNNVMTCNADKCLFILSEKSSLSGADLPADGTEYASGDQIGSSVFVAYSYDNYGTLWLGGSVAARRASGLKPGTTYYLYAFPYNTDCTGIKYNTTDIPYRVITTAIAPVNAVSVVASSITDTGFTLNIDKGSAEQYILAVSQRQMNASTMTVLSAKQGGYQAGDKLNFRYKTSSLEEFYTLEVLAVGNAAQFEVKDAQRNEDYYYYVWSTDATQSRFSFETRTCGVATPYYAPAFLAFDSASVVFDGESITPAGWTIPTGNKFRVANNGESRGLTVGLCPPLDAYGDKVGDLHTNAVSPIIKGGGAFSASVELYFWQEDASLNVHDAAIREGDGLEIQYKKLSESDWKTLNTLTSTNTKSGLQTIVTPEFNTEEDFQLRFVASSTVKPDGGFTNASINSITFGGVCNAISSIPEVSQIMHDRVTLSWEDANNTPMAKSYDVRYRLSENSEWVSQTSKLRTYTLTGLNPHTQYTVQVAAVCSRETSDYVDVTFTTFHGMPYEFALASGSTALPEGVTLKTGVLPAAGEAVLAEPDADKTVWAPMQKATNVYGAGVTVDANLNNPLWLNLPTISTGVLSGTARLSLKLSAWSDGNTAQAATFGETDTLWVLFSKDNKFNATSAKIKVNLSEVTPQGKTYTSDFEVKDAYQYWAVYTNLQTAGNVLFIDSLNIDWMEQNCNGVTNIRNLKTDFYSVDLAWDGEGMEYGIFYNDRKTDVWDSVYTHETTYTLGGLSSFTNYQYYIVTYCDADRLKASEKSSMRYFQTKKVCEVPTLEVLEGSETWQGVTLITHSNEQSREFIFDPRDYYFEDGTILTAGNQKKDTIRITGLYYVQDTLNGVVYFVRVRGLCPDDTSAWSEPKEFTLLPTPVCHKPTDLKAEVNVATKTATLSWTAGTNNIAYTAFIRAGSSRQDTISTSRNSLNYRVEPDVVYTWSMMSACEKPLNSGKTYGPSFSCSNVGNESVQSFDKAVKVRVFENQIIIENNDGLYIKSLQAFSVDGKLLRTYTVNSNQNAYIYHTLPKGAALLRVLGENGKTATYKTIIL